jgi:hypothetical protein
VLRLKTGRPAHFNHCYPAEEGFPARFARGNDRKMLPDGICHSGCHSISL